MSLTNRPYVGTWALNQQGVVRHTPDVLVYVNGHLDVPGCQTCSGRIPLQRFITTVSADPGLQPPSTAQVSMQVPRHYGDDLFRDGQFILVPGLEIHIYMRGYFPVSGMISDEDAKAAGVDVSNAVMYPYYLVHHGVVTEVNHEFSGGEHSASLNIADMLHFWQYQRMATNASLMGSRPSNSKVKMNLVGHSMNAMTPYGIIYNLWRDSFGAAGGVEFAMGNATNTAADSSGFNESMWSFIIRYWEQRFSESVMSLRMYGADGSLYNAFEQAFLAGLSTSQAQELAKHDFANLSDSQSKDFSQWFKVARAIGFDPLSVVQSAKSERDAEDGNNLGISVTQMQAFVHDVSQWGQVNLWESQYEPKLELAQSVTQISGFEFYQDVDGDVVFKPPFYNLDTSDAPAYVIRPVDIISISFREAEPEATTIKGTGGAFGNMQVGLDGEWGIRAEYIDYRLVAKYGWRQQTFESQYYGDARAMFFSAVNRMDLFNIGVKSGTLQIPIRAELRPGYPVFIEHLDLFGYVQSMNHSVAFGGQCTTTLNLVGLRSKFFGPGTTASGEKPKVSDLDLGATTKSKLILQTTDDAGHPRLVGVPNVVMGVDTSTLNPLFYVVGADLEDISTEPGINSLIRAARQRGILTLADSGGEELDIEERWLRGPYKLHSGQGDEEVTIPSPGELLSQIQAVRKAQNDPYGEVTTSTVDDQEQAIASAQENAAAFYELIRALGGPVWTDIPDGQATWNYLDALNDMKSTFNPGARFPGYYRYYSSSVEDHEAQGMELIVADEEGDGTTTLGDKEPTPEPVKVRGIKDSGEEIVWADVQAEYGIPIARIGSGEVESVPTHNIQTLSFARHTYTKLVPKSIITSGQNPALQIAELYGVIENAFRLKDSRSTAEEAFKSTYDTLAKVVSDHWDASPTDWSTRQSTIQLLHLKATSPTTEDPLPGWHYQTYISELTDYLIGLVAAAFNTELKALHDEWGVPNKNPSGDKNADDKVRAFRALSSKANNFYLDLNEVAPDIGFFTSSPVDFSTDIILEPREVTFYTPVFPVSDAKGFEVIGSYRYGRGLTVNSGGTWEQITVDDGFSWDSINAVEEFLNDLANADTDNDGIVSPEEAAIAAEQVGVPRSMIMAADGSGETVFEQKHINRIADVSKDRVHKTTVVNAAYSLADLTVETGTNVCECKAAQAELFLEAFLDTSTSATTIVEQPDDASQWVSDRMVEASQAWASSQAALRGEYEESSSDLLTSAVEQLSSTQQQAEQAISDISEAVGSLTEGDDG